jgi:hypothetical protein
VSNKGIIEKIFRKNIENSDFKFEESHNYFLIEINYTFLDEPVNICFSIDTQLFSNENNENDQIKNNENIIKKLFDKLDKLEKKNVENERKINELLFFRDMFGDEKDHLCDIDKKISKLETEIKHIIIKIKLELKNIEKIILTNTQYRQPVSRCIFGDHHNRFTINNEIIDKITIFAFFDQTFIDEYDMNNNILFVSRKGVNITWENIKQNFPYIFKLFDKYKKLKDELNKNQTIKYYLNYYT